MEKDVNTTGQLRPGPMDVIDYAMQVANTVGKCEPAEAAQMVESLNVDAVSSGLVSQSVMIASEFIIQKNYTIGNATTILDFVPSDENAPKIKTALGQFIGFERIIHGKDEILMYVLEGGSYKDTRKFSTILAPVLDTRILLDEKVLEVHESMEIHERPTLTKDVMLRRLAEVKDRTFAGNFDMFAEIIDRGVLNNARQLKEAAKVAYELYNDPIIGGEEVIQHSVLNLFAGLFVIGDNYRVEGYHIEASTDAGQQIDLYPAVSLGKLQSVAMVIDFDYDNKTNHLLYLDGTRQPALMVRSNSGDDLVMPIANITKFGKRRLNVKSGMPPIDPNVGKS